jgi:hypothetical protein
MKTLQAVQISERLPKRQGTYVFEDEKGKMISETFDPDDKRSVLWCITYYKIWYEEQKGSREEIEQRERLDILLENIGSSEFSKLDYLHNDISNAMAQYVSRYDEEIKSLRYNLGLTGEIISEIRDILNLKADDSLIDSIKAIISGRHPEQSS